jgi:AraC family transcriptional regulator
MARLLGHGKAKYTTGTCLASSHDQSWRGLLAERWRHSEGDLGEVQPRDTEVIVMLGGKLRVRRRGDGQLQYHDAVPGTVWLCPAGVREDMIHLYGEITDCIHLYLPAKALAKTALQELDVDPKSLQLHYAGGFRDPLIEAIGKTVAAELQSPSPVAGTLIDTLSAALGAYVVRSYSSLRAESHPSPQARGTLDGRRLARVLAFIDAHFGQELSLEELAREACLSPFHFARSFKAAMGEPPHRYLLQRRVEHAKTLLRDGALSTTEVAMTCGFASPAHFATSFRRATGVTPSLFRRL